jgi:hypothetical protein
MQTLSPTESRQEAGNGGRQTTMTLRNIRHAILTLIAAAALGHAETKAYISTFGPWPMCVNGALGGVPGIPAGDCSWYVPGTESYSLNVWTDSPATDAYSYKITVVLKDGSTKTVDGIAARKDDKTTGYTEIPKVVFGGIVDKVASIEITEHTVISRQRFGESVVVLRRVR